MSGCAPFQNAACRGSWPYVPGSSSMHRPLVLSSSSITRLVRAWYLTAKCSGSNPFLPWCTVSALMHRCPWATSPPLSEACCSPCEGASLERGHPWVRYQFRQTGFHSTRQPGNSSPNTSAKGLTTPLDRHPNWNLLHIPCLASSSILRTARSCCMLPDGQAHPVIVGEQHCPSQEVAFTQQH